MRLPVIGTAAALIVMPLVISPPDASAYDNGLPINGTYVVVSDGRWSRTNEIYRDLPTVRSTWTVTSECENPQWCTGTVVSDQGWSAALEWHVERWFVFRDVPNWQPCPDGSSYPGRQMFRFYPVNVATGRVQAGSDTLVGEDITTGQTGACNLSEPVEVRMPLRMQRQS